MSAAGCGCPGRHCSRSGSRTMDTVPLDRDTAQTTAPNGVTVLTERVAHVRSAALGIWVRTASAHEPRLKMGVSHLLEHMVFKGTERRTAQQIALELEARGGSLDAYTSRDTTAFQARVLDADLPRAVDVLTDIVRHPVLRDADLRLERNVVLEEISTVEDTPDDLVFELSSQALWPEHPYGFSILGTDAVRSANRRKYALMVLTSLLGGGMSSRLFQRIREELGLAYAIYSFSSFFRQVGVIGTYVGTQPATAAQAVAAIRDEYATLARDGLQGARLDEAKQQTAGQLVLSLESPTARMYRLASLAVHGEPFHSLDAMVAAVTALTATDLAAVAAEFLAPERQTTVWLGPKAAA